MAEAKSPSSNAQVKYLNNIVEQDHRAVKRVTKPILNFKSLRAARNILAGIELMRMIRKEQLMMSGLQRRSFADQIYALAGKIRHVLGIGIHSYPKHVRRVATRQNCF